MATQFSFTLPDKPGALANVAEALGDAAVNIDGIAGICSNGKGVISLVTDNPSKAESSLKGEGIEFKKKEVLLVQLEDKPGQIALLSRNLADEGINIESFYITMGGQQVIGTDNFERTKEIAEDLGIL